MIVISRMGRAEIRKRRGKKKKMGIHEKMG